MALAGLTVANHCTHKLVRFALPIVFSGWKTCPILHDPCTTEITRLYLRGKNVCMTAAFSAGLINRTKQKLTSATVSHRPNITQIEI